jgi:salicylate hydroxylase
MRDTGLDVTRVNLPEAVVRSNPDTAPAMDYVALFFGPQTTIANVPIRRGMAIQKVFVFEETTN